MSTCYYGEAVSTSKSRSNIGSRARGVVANDAVLLGPLPMIGDDENEDICSLPPVTPTLRACLAFIPKWTYDAR